MSVYGGVVPHQVMARHASIKAMHIKETTEMVIINPLTPQSWGTLKAGGHPQHPGRKYPAPFFSSPMKVVDSL